MEDPNRILHLTDSGCDQHRCCHLRFAGDHATVIQSMLYSLPRNRDKYTYICEYGKTHCLIFKSLESAGGLSG
jgi:hypothetical protein